MFKKKSHKENRSQNEDVSLIQINTNTAPVLPKLEITQPEDKYEQQADTIADKVIQAGEQTLIQQPISERITPSIQSKAEGSNEISGALNDKIAAAEGGGHSMDSDTKSFMNNRFSTDFSDVKIHTDGEAIQMSKELDAKAFATGKDIYFNEGQYQPHSDSGKHLLAHELTHFLQQGGSNETIQRTVTGANGDKDKTPAKDGDICEGWESDLQSLTIDAARFHFRTEHGEDIHVDTADCVSATSQIMKVCDLVLTDGRKVRVMYNPAMNIIRVQHEESGVLKFCRYSYTCSETGTVTYTKIECNE